MQYKKSEATEIINQYLKQIEEFWNWKEEFLETIVA